MRFTLTRRRFALGLGTLTAAAGAGVLGSGILNKRELSLIAAILDAILPADESPGALDLSLDQQFEKLCQRDSKWQRTSSLLQTAINQSALSQHRQSFAQISAQQREALLVELLERNSVVRSELNRLRLLLFDWYYSSPAGHASLGYQLPSHYPAYNDSGNNG